MTDERQDPKDIGAFQADDAWDQRHAYDNNEHAADAYRQNVRDTCSGIGQPEDADEAVRAFDKAWDQISGNAFKDAFDALKKCKVPSHEVKVLLHKIQIELDK